MFILPFLYSSFESVSKIPVHKIQCFLEKGGDSLLQMDLSDIKDFCQQNDIPVIRQFIEKDVVYIEVDPSIKLSAFYSFHDPNISAIEVWRTFLLIGDTKEDPWGVNKKLKVPFSDVLATISSRLNF